MVLFFHNSTLGAFAASVGAENENVHTFISFGSVLSENRGQNIQKRIICQGNALVAADIAQELRTSPPKAG